MPAFVGHSVPNLRKSFAPRRLGTRAQRFLMPRAQQSPAFHIVRRNAPIGGIHAALDKTPEGRMRPCRRGVRVTVLDRVEMDVIAMPLKIVIVADAMLPEAALPYRLLALGAARGGNGRLVLRRAMAREFALDRHPAAGKIIVIFRQRPQAMQMIGEQHKGVDGEGMPHLHRPERLAQQRHITGVGKQRPPPERDHSEKISRPREAQPSIFHAPIVGRASRARQIFFGWRFWIAGQGWLRLPGLSGTACRKCWARGAQPTAFRGCRAQPKMLGTGCPTYSLPGLSGTAENVGHGVPNLQPSGVVGHSRKCWARGAQPTAFRGCRAQPKMLGTGCPTYSLPGLSGTAENVGHGVPNLQARRIS